MGETKDMGETNLLPDDERERPAEDERKRPTDDERKLLAADELKRQATRVNFLNREAAEVYLLLDFLSGRADRSLRPTSDEQARSLLQDQLHESAKVAGDGAPEELMRQQRSERDRRAIEADLKDPTQLVLRTMQIKYPIGKGDTNFETNAAFLMRARDVLNTRAAPANGATIAFTSMVSAQRAKAAGVREGDVTSWEFAESAYPWLKDDAKRLDAWIRRWLKYMLFVLLVAILVSGYSAWGKVMLDTLDAVRRDDTATRQVIPARASLAIALDPSQNAGAAPSLNCGTQQVSGNDVINPCFPFHDIMMRKNVTYMELESWLPWPASTRMGEDLAARQKNIEQLAIASLTVLGNYLMPILYGLLGSLAFVFRRYYDRLTSHMLSPRDMRANSIRLLLGTVIGGCIGLVYSGSGAAQTTGTLGLAVTLSASALAFLAGYGVEGVFKALDTVITQVFRAGADERSPRHLTAN